MDMSGLEWTPDVSIYRQPWRENTGACLQAPAGEGITMRWLAYRIRYYRALRKIRRLP